MNWDLAWVIGLYVGFVQAGDRRSRQHLDTWMRLEPPESIADAECRALSIWSQELLGMSFGVFKPPRLANELVGFYERRVLPHLRS